MATVVAPLVRSRSQSKLVLFLIFGLLTVFVTYMKNARIFDPTSEIAQHFAPVRWYLLPHAFFGALAMMLGVQRTGVTAAAGGLQQAGLIHYRRGNVTIIDRPGLIRRSCECYGVSKREFDRLLGERAIRRVRSGRK